MKTRRSIFPIYFSRNFIFSSDGVYIINEDIYGPYLVDEETGEILFVENIIEEEYEKPVEIVVS